MSSVSVIVVTWNGLALLRDCLAALSAQTLPHELIVVDNGSRDGSVAWLRAHAPQARVIALPTNHGFAGGNNVGLRSATGEYLVLINNDAVPAPDFLERLVAPLAGDARLGASAGVLTFAQRPQVIASAGMLVSRDGVHRDWLAGRPLTALPQQPREIFGASGGAVCYRRAALEDAGLFDERFFAYLEDADLAWRLRLLGWRCTLAPDAHARHVYSATGGQGSPFKQRLLARNRWRVILRCVPAPLLRDCWPAMVRYDLLALGYALLTRQPAMIAGRLEVLRDVPNLLGQRRRIQARRQVAADELARWLAPAVTVREMLAEQRRLRSVLQAA